MFKKSILNAAVAAGVLLAVNQASAAVCITEYAYQGGAGEFVELTNLGPAAVNFAGWVYDDDSRISTIPGGGIDLSAFGSVASGESVIFTEASASAFRTFWGLSSSVKVIGGVTTNLSRGDEINIYNNVGQLVDRLTYNDETIPGSVRTNVRSGHLINQAALGTNDATKWVLSAAGDFESSYIAGSSIGSPGHTSFTPTPAVPVPAAAWLFGSALGGLVVMRRRNAV